MGGIKNKMEDLKNINEDILKDDKFKYLSLTFTNLNTAIIEREGIQNFEINTIYEIKGVNKIILNFNLVLDRKYCDNKIIEYEDDPDKDGYVLPIEEQRKISSLFYLDSGTEIDEICLVDSDMKELNRYEIYSSANKKVNPDERVHYMRRNFSDSIISVKLNVLLKDAMIDNQLNHYANKYLKDNNIE